LIKLNVEINKWVIEGFDGKRKRKRWNKKKKKTFREKEIKLNSRIN
jgi:hypothetical protein